MPREEWVRGAPIHSHPPRAFAPAPSPHSLTSSIINQSHNISSMYTYPQKTNLSFPRSDEKFWSPLHPFVLAPATPPWAIEFSGDEDE